MAFVGKTSTSCFYPGCETIAGDRLYCFAHRPSAPAPVFCSWAACREPRPLLSDRCAKHRAMRRKSAQLVRRDD